MFMKEEARKIKLQNRNTFGHAFLVYHEKLAARDQNGGDSFPMDRVLQRLFFQDINTIVETLNTALPSSTDLVEFAKHYSSMAECIQETVGPQFHKNFRQIDVMANGHLDMAIYILLRSNHVGLFWKTLEKMSNVAAEFVKADSGSWEAFIVEVQGSTEE